MDGGSRCCHPRLSFTGVDALMPIPFIALGIAAGAGMATGYVIDHLIGDGTYTKEEAVLDASLGMVGGSLVKPALKIGSKAKTSLRLSRGSPSLTERAVGFTRVPVKWGSKADQAAWVSLRTAKHSGQDAKRIARFVTVSGVHSVYVSTHGGRGSPIVRTPTNQKEKSSKWVNPGGRPGSKRRKFKTKFPKPGSPSSVSRQFEAGKRSKSWAPRRPSRCPSGHYWNRNLKRCVRYRRRKR